MLILNPFRHGLRVLTSLHPSTPFAELSYISGNLIQGRTLSTSGVLQAKKVLKQFKLADIGEGITECEVIRWAVKPASQIQSFDPLLEVQSDKASVEITSPFDGVVRELLVQEGQIAKVGNALCTIEIDEEAIEELEAKGVVESVGQDQGPDMKQHEESNDTISVDDHGKKIAHSFSDTQHSPERRPHPLDPNRPQSEMPPDADVLATPSTRHYARSQKVDLALLLPGSGKGGRIERSDVDAFIARRDRGSSEETGDWQEVPGAQSGEDVVVDLGRTRYGMWKAMTKSLDIPHFGYSTSLDLTAFHSILPPLNNYIPMHFQSKPLQPSNLPVNPTALHPLPPAPQIPDHAKYAKLTYLPFLLKTLSKAMMEWPVFRSSITPSASSESKPTLTIRPTPHISLALSTPTGLYTPTLTSVHSESIYSIASRLRHLSHLGRQIPCALTPKEMPKKGGTITVSNVGAIGKGEYAHPVLVPGGGVAIVALGRARWMWDYDHGEEDITEDGLSRGKIGEKRLVMGVSWTADHRVVEGAELAAFVECWRSWVENPQRLIAESI